MDEALLVALHIIEPELHDEDRGFHLVEGMSEPVVGGGWS